MDKIRHIPVADGITLHVAETDKFKSNRMSVAFMQPFRPETASVNSLLPMVLCRRNAACPDVRSLRLRLCDLYGAEIKGSSSRRGEVQLISVSVRSISPEYTPVDVTEECVALLTDTIFNPVLENGVFPADDVATERRNLVQAIEAVINDKHDYAKKRLYEEMCGAEPFGTGENGTVATAKAVTPEMLTKAWRNIIETSAVEITVIGSGSDGEKIAESWRNAFAKVARRFEGRPVTELVYKNAEVKSINEKMEVEQANLLLGYRTGLSAPNDDMTPIIVANEMFGGGVNSKLFVNVREKLNLCYFCWSGIERYKGIMTVSCGIEAANRQVAIDEISAQLEKMKSGDFTDEEIAVAKRSISGVYRMVDDSLGAIESFNIGQVMSGTDYSPAEMSEKINAVTREQIIEAFAKIAPDTVYCLKGENE